MTKNEGRRYWQEIQITASDKERRRRRSPPLIQEINPGVRCTQKKFVKLYTPSVKSKKNTRYIYQDKREDHEKCQGIQ